ncbi:Protein of unknown function [Evansella caseinilytica]|uniref:DUF3788 domain-containing protein n=1 Tax=Evansella caseinilytica TaxID=1503961 RepID=A0A1H3HB95_9BACI|nr:DUF3788 domain-containing protein [Evansella caseinilytica]SDY11899.1 Protein of unknown function [Evansella caseinilytica]
MEKIPDEEELCKLMGDGIYEIWTCIIQFMKRNYTLDKQWRDGGKTGVYELKYRKSSRTICTLYPKESGLCVLIIFGKAEREKFEQSRADFSKYINDFYDETHQYHDGKWMLFDVENMRTAEEIQKLIAIKRRPDKKTGSLKV